MAIQVRRGLQKDFKPDKMLPGEMAVTTDTRRIYATFAPGDCKRMATYEDMQDDIKEANEEIITELTESVTTATQAATSAATAAQTATTNANKATQDATTAVSNADTATSEANAAASEARSAAEDAHKAVIDDSAASTSRTYSSSKINALIAGVTGFSVEVVDQLPTSGIDTHKIYFVPKETSKQTAGDIYDEYLYVQNAWEHIGTTDVDLSQYYTKTEASVRDLKDNVVEFTSGDCGEDGDAAQLTVAKLTSGETLKSMMNKVSRMFTNVRYILRLLGSTDISSESVKIGDGTITGALSTLNSNLSKALFLKQFAVKNGLTLAPGQRISYLYEKNTFDVQGYVRLSFFTFSSGQNYVSIDVAFVDNNVYFTIINNHQTSSLTFDVYCLIVYGKKEIVNIAS